MATTLSLLLISQATGARVEKRVQPKPSFRMTPLVVQANARPGQEVRFSITLEAFDKPLDVMIHPVGLQQDGRGLILPDVQARITGDIRLLTKSRVRLRAGESTEVRGAWQLPATKSDFFMAGLLVTDSGAALEAENGQSSDRVGGRVRFVTRYLLRLEANCRQGAASTDLAIRDGKLLDREGSAWASCQLDATRSGSVHTEILGRVLNAEGEPVTTPFPMYMSVRQNQPEKTRRQVHLLTGSKVQVVAPVPAPLFPGKYQLAVQRKGTGAQATEQRFPLTVGENDFPAQRSLVAEVVRSLEVSPRQIELSTLRGGRRRVPLQFHNRGPQAVTVQLSAPDADAWLMIRPQQFTLAPGRKRNVLVAYRGGTNVQDNRYGKLVAEVVPTETVQGGRVELPVGLIADESSVARIQFGSAHYLQTNENTILLVPTKNEGTRHALLQTQLTLVDSQGRKWQAAAGFGRWLLPGASSQLEFKLPRLPAASYSLDLAPPVFDSAEDVYESLITIEN
ncbi:MAG: hypothetical protein RH917_05855 [Lacipirellulaceae bacterium]